LLSSSYCCRRRIAVVVVVVVVVVTTHHHHRIALNAPSNRRCIIVVITSDATIRFGRRTVVVVTATADVTITSPSSSSVVERAAADSLLMQQSHRRVLLVVAADSTITLHSYGNSNIKINQTFLVIRTILLISINSDIVWERKCRQWSEVIVATIKNGTWRGSIASGNGNQNRSFRHNFFGTTKHQHTMAPSATVNPAAFSHFLIPTRPINAKFEDGVEGESSTYLVYFLDNRLKMGCGILMTPIVCCTSI
jgi:hypothetical protein